MALVKQEDEQGQAAPTTGGAAYVGGGGGGGQPNNSVTQGAGNAQAPAFHDIMDYVGPTGASQSVQMGQAVNRDVNNLAGAASKDVEGWNSDAMGQVKAGTPTFNADTANSWKTPYDSAAGAASMNTGVAATAPAPTTPTNFANPGYTGPSSTQPVVSAFNPTASVQTLGDKSKSLTTPGGVQSEMNSLYGAGGGGNYTPGMSGLDAAIFNSGTGGQGALQNASDQYSNINNLWGAYKDQVNTAETAGKTQGDAVQGQWNTAISDAANSQGVVQNQYNDLAG